MTEEYKQGDEFKTGILSAGAKRFKIEGKRQGKEAYADDAGADEITHDQADHDDGFGRFMILATAEEQARTLARITEAEIACEQAMIAARKREQEAQAEIERIRGRATRTDDGRIVYLTADGSKAFDDDGNELTPEEMTGIDWNPAAPTWEQRQEATEKREQTIKDIQDERSQGIWGRAGHSGRGRKPGVHPSRYAETRGNRCDHKNSGSGPQTP
jgi:hypothetical protein